MRLKIVIPTPSGHIYIVNRAKVYISQWLITKIRFYKEIVD